MTGIEAAIIGAVAAAGKAAAAAGSAALAGGKALAVGAGKLAVAGGKAAATAGGKKLLAGAVTAGVSATGKQIVANRQARAQVDALNANQNALAEYQALQLQQERLAALQFSRQATVMRGNMLAATASLGGIGSAGDILSALSTSQSIEADTANLSSRSRFDAIRRQSANIYTQAQGIADTYRNPLVTGLIGAGVGTMVTLAGMATSAGGAVAGKTATTNPGSGATSVPTPPPLKPNEVLSSPSSTPTIERG